MTILLLLALWMVADAGSVPCPAASAEMCKCGYPSVQGAFDQSRAVFTGVVVELQDPLGVTRVDSAGNLVASGLNFQPGVLRVTHGWTGARDDDTITVLGAPFCGVTFRAGEEYLVYALADEDGVLTTSPCQRSRLLAPPIGSEDVRLPPPREDVAALDSIVRARRP